MRNQQTQLDSEMDQRRIVLRMTWRQVAEAANISLAGLGAIRRGERRPTALTKGRIEDALRWAPRSVDTILAGGKPTPLPDWHLQSPRSESESIADLEQREGESDIAYAERLLEKAMELLREQRGA